MEKRIFQILMAMVQNLDNSQNKNNIKIQELKEGDVMGVNIL